MLIEMVHSFQQQGKMKKSKRRINRPMDQLTKEGEACDLKTIVLGDKKKGKSVETRPDGGRRKCPIRFVPLKKCPKCQMSTPKMSKTSFQFVPLRQICLTCHFCPSIFSKKMFALTNLSNSSFSSFS